MLKLCWVKGRNLGGLFHRQFLFELDPFSSEYQNLLSNESSSKVSIHKRRLLVFIGIAMTLGCIGAIVAIVVINSYASAGPTPKQLEGFTLDDVLSGKFYAESFNGTWISDHEFSYRSSLGGINIFDVSTGVVKSILSSEIVIQLQIQSYRFSPDQNFILYSFDGRQNWRYSSYSRYSVIDLVKKQVFPLQPQQFRTRGIKDPQLFLRFATWNKQGNSLIYVYENDIYVRESPDALTDKRLTTNGEKDTIFNGIPDWVYEEEVFGTDNTIWIAKNGLRMVYASFDDRQVDTMEYSLYGEPSNSIYQYPVTASIRYPKAGRTNPSITLVAVSLGLDGSDNSVEHNLVVKAFTPPTETENKEHYVTAVTWTTDSEVMVVWVNRHQNVSYLSFCDVESSTCKSEHVVSEPNGWVDIYAAPKFSSDGRQFLMILPVSQGAAGNFKHIVLYDRNTNDVTPLSSGLFEVVEILGWDETRKVAYFMGTQEGKPASRHMYKVSTDSTTGNEFVCVTCGSVNADNKECTYNSVEFSTDLGYYVHGCDGPNAPRSVIKETTTNREVFLVSDNEVLRDRLSQKAQPRPLNLQVPLEGNYTAQVRLMLPPSLNRNKAQKYPLLVYVYGGPQSQQVSDRYRVDWGTHLSSSRGVIYALIDGRGSGYQGDKMLQEIYRRMGTVEIEDQIRVTQYLAETLPFVDANQTAIWGWSYGGYATAMTLAKDTENAFKCGMSVAPVTNWIYYDSIYTERYMGLPTSQDNEQAYVNSDVSRMVENFRHKRFYLIHGTADDNVHYQQSLMLARSLEAADILFRQQSYTDENHSIAHLKTHLYHSLGTFLMTDCFGLENEVWG